MTTATRPTAEPTEGLLLAAYLLAWPLVSEDEARAELGLTPIADEDRAGSPPPG